MKINISRLSYGGEYFNTKGEQLLTLDWHDSDKTLWLLELKAINGKYSVTLFTT